MRLYALSVTVLFLCGFELVGSSEEELSEDDNDYVTPTPDYDYNATFDYYYVTGVYTPENQELVTKRNQAATLSHLTSVLLLGLAAGHII